jgi:hypothetical protein
MSTSAGQTGMPLPRGQALWMLARPALASLLTDPVVRAELESARVYEILQPGQAPLPGVAATLVVTVSAIADLSAALAGNQLPAGTRAILYDTEAWTFTPTAEQRDPVQAVTTAAELAHAHGLQLIVSPALDLMSVLAPGSSTPQWQQFLDLKLAAEIAKLADVIELQGQSLERTPATYATFVQEATAQARSANPDVTVLAGLSTNPPGAVVNSQQLAAAIQASWPTVDGYWINIPTPGPRCPTCNPPRPDVGIATMRAVL